MTTCALSGAIRFIVLGTGDLVGEGTGSLIETVRHMRLYCVMCFCTGAAFSEAATNRN